MLLLKCHTSLQSVNGDPTFYYSDFSALGAQLSGEITVKTSGDDDYIGFALGFEPGDTKNSNADYLLVDWKQGDQSWGGYGYRGIAVSRVTGVPSLQQFWTHTGKVAQLARGINLGRTGWRDYQTYKFEFEFSASRLRVFIDGTLELDVTAPVSNPFTDGRLAFYNFSQAYVEYAGVESYTIGGPEGSLVSFSRRFTDPGYGYPGGTKYFDATIDWGDGRVENGIVNFTPGSEGVLTTGAMTGEHIYEDNGTYDVTLTVYDDDGGSDSQKNREL